MKNFIFVVFMSFFILFFIIGIIQHHYAGIWVSWKFVLLYALIASSILTFAYFIMNQIIKK